MTSSDASETSHVGLTVRDVDRALGFYRDLLGLELVDRSTSGGQVVADVLGYPGVELDRAILRLPQTNAYLELLQYRKGEGTPVDPLHGNPGTCHLAFYTDDLTETWDTLKAHGSELQGEDITLIEGGVFDAGRVIYCTDPDGIRVEFLEGPAYLDGTVRDPTAVPNATRANETSHAGIHVRDRDRALEFWVDQLGFEVVAKFIADDRGTREVINLPEADLNLAILRLPGTNAFFEVIEYQNAPDRHPVDTDHANPGTCHVAVYVDDIEATLSKVQAAGSDLISTGVVELTGGALAGARALYCKNADGFRVEFLQSDRYLDGSARSRTTQLTA
jgi:catechol 2,3-dioxygenase-like lactoylglutathione lyase family enzyme